MINVITTGIKQLDRSIERKRRGLIKAQKKSALTTGRDTRSYTNKLIREEVNVKVRTINKNIRYTTRQSATTVTPIINIRGSHIPVADMRARQVKAGVRYNPYKNKGPVTVPGAFKATMPSGHKGVYKRHGPKVTPKRGRYANTGIKRQKIKELYGPSIISLFRKRQPKIFGFAAKRMTRELTRNIERIK